MTYKLLSYQSATGGRAGILIGETVFDAARLANRIRYATVLDVLDDWARADACFAVAATHGTSIKGESLSKVSLLAPILWRKTRSGARAAPGFFPRSPTICPPATSPCAKTSHLIRRFALTGCHTRGSTAHAV